MAKYRVEFKGLRHDKKIKACKDCKLSYRMHGAEYACPFVGILKNRELKQVRPLNCPLVRVEK